MDKVYKNIEELIEILRNRKLNFEDIEYTKRILLKENYYHIINGYKKIFVLNSNENECFIDGTSFNEIYALYFFDREIRTLFLKYILIIENNFKSYIANIFSKKYGHKDYLKRENFISGCYFDEQFFELEKKVNNEIVRNIKNSNQMIIHYSTKYNYIPLWVLVRIITLGNISKFYKLMKIEEKKEVAKIAKLHYNDINIYLKMLTLIRNACAHDEILFDIRLNTIISVENNAGKYHRKLNISKKSNIYEKGINDLFSIVIIMKFCLEQNEFFNFYTNLTILIKNLEISISTVKFNNILDMMGFPENYNEL